ncbi:hypothetical protein JHK84_042992 [Glycine max]|nr:hypothetical protein JHK84_042992 [Glycine max]
MKGYYRCSSSKACPARKQVERSRTDPNMLGLFAQFGEINKDQSVNLLSPPQGFDVQQRKSNALDSFHFFD